MRIVIDLQGAQSESRFRGIGRYSLALALGVARNAGDHEVWLVLNAGLGAAIEDIRQAFAGLVPRERIRVFDILAPAAEIDTGNSANARSSELLREYFIAQLEPDAVLVTSLFEGFVDNSVVSVGRFVPGVCTAVVLYDLIPFLNPAAYLGTDAQRHYYERKIASLRQAGLLLAISDYSRLEALDALDLDPQRVVSISTAVDASFAPGTVDAARHAALCARFGLQRPFIMYAPGGFDSRKNIDGLITAFSELPPALRAQHQLLIASKLNEPERDALEAHARRCNLEPGELVLTGYVDDGALVDLYRSCALFVFPSKHEGFGLPALEAMSCGAPVIGANTTSVPEVIGWDEALFDPTDTAAISGRIAAVLGDDDLLGRLRAHGRRQAASFSWDRTAQRAVAALEEHHARVHSARPVPPGAKPRVLFVSPLPPERTGVADYAVRILPTLLPYFDIELVCDQPHVAMPPGLEMLPCHDPAWLRAHAGEFAHIIYQFGNSPFHSFMLPLLEEHPGVVVLHDFYLSSMLSYEQMTGHMPGVWSRALFESHGFNALATSLSAEGWELAKQVYPSNLEILRNASHVIVHSDYARQLATQWYGPDAGRNWSAAQLPRALPSLHDRDAARRALGIRPDAFVVCNFGFVAPTKHCLELLQAWVAARLPADRACELVFVGENEGGDYGRQMLDTIRAADAGDRIRISGWISDEDYLHYLQAADVGVQLRTGSRGETSGTVLDCMIYGLPTLINANGSMAEFPHDAVWMLPDRFSQAELAEALSALRKDPALRKTLGQAALDLMKVRNSPERCGSMYQQALARDWALRRSDRRALYEVLLDAPAADDAFLQQSARSIARAHDPLQQRQLLVDVTAISQHDLKSGIERVVRNQLVELLRLADSGYRVEPVFFRHEDGQMRCRYARSYGARVLGIGTLLEGYDTLVEVQAGDVYYSADHSPHAVMSAADEGLFANWRARGVEINFLLHDLLPVLRPEFFPPGTDVGHAAWLARIAVEADRIICISGAVADELRTWLANAAVAAPGLDIAVLHHGADLGGPPPAPLASTPRLQQIAARPSFLMVGTIEPRKGHLQAIDAVDLLWAAGVDANLVIVGNEGWKPLADADRRTIPHIIERLRQHPELGKRLLWLTGVDDSELEQIYLASTCLLSPSEGEGFGLPLIEAGRYDLPVLARDIPVFREVGGASASYFSGLDGAALADAMRAWLDRHAAGTLPTAPARAWHTWHDNVRQLLAIVGNGQPQAAGQTVSPD